MLFYKDAGREHRVSVVVSSVYGFISGAYMPISQFANGIQIFVSLLPGTYGTGLFRNHFMGGVLAEIGNYFPPKWWTASALLSIAICSSSGIKWKLERCF